MFFEYDLVIERYILLDEAWEVAFNMPWCRVPYIAHVSILNGTRAPSFPALEWMRLPINKEGVQSSVLPS